MVALVTGASSGIGRDIAIELAKIKYDIIAIARNEEALIKLKEEVEKTYNVTVAGIVNKEDVEKLTKGVEIVDNDEEVLYFYEGDK